MKANGPRIERETVIIFNELEETADIWTASNGTYKLLLKRGFHPFEDRKRSATFKIPKKCVSLRKAVAISENRRKALAKARSKAPIQLKQNRLTLQ